MSAFRMKKPTLEFGVGSTSSSSGPKWPYKGPVSKLPALWYCSVRFSMRLKSYLLVGSVSIRYPFVT
jgi:hypothetical protein